MTLFRREALEHRRYADQAGVPLPPAPPPAVLTWGILACVAAAVGYLALGSYARKEHVSGYLAPKLGVARVAARQPGLIVEVAVHDGELVAAGAPLVTIRMGGLDGSGGDVDDAVLRALRAQRDQVGEQLAIEQARLGQEYSRLADHLGALADELATLHEAARLQSARTSLVAQQVEAVRGLMAAGSFSRIEFEHRQDTMLEQRQSAAALAREVAGKQSEMDSDTHARAALPTTLAARQAALRVQAAEIETRIAETEGRQATLLRAPIAGRVSALQAQVGQQADPVTPLLSVVPEGDALRAELLVPARAVGEIRVGQTVRIAFEAFPSARFGLSGGRVATVSRTLLRPSEVAGPVIASGPCYRVTVLLDTQEIRAGDVALRLAPDMALSADIVVERRSLLQWLLSPLRDRTA